VLEEGAPLVLDVRWLPVVADEREFLIQVHRLPPGDGGVSSTHAVLLQCGSRSKMERIPHAWHEHAPRA
jgi:hypothetical protein